MTEPTTNVRFVMGAVMKVEERFNTRAVSDAGREAVMEDVSAGWWVTLDTGISLGMGRLQPHCAAGDELIVSFRRRPA